MGSVESWGRYPRVKQRAIAIGWRDEAESALGHGPILAHGLGRSYGDSCLNEGGTLLLTRGLSRFLAFDPETGLLRCEAGVSLAEILEFAVPRGFFLPVTPGTKFVTVGGAIANDVHGKNHHADGTFGRFVRRFELLRSDGRRLICSPDENETYFQATIGGLGLTGFITWAEVQLRRVPGPLILQESLKLRSLDDFFRINEASERDWLYTVAWIDCLARGRKLGRGIYYRGNHLPSSERRTSRPRGPRLNVPFDAPDFLLGETGVRLFNFLYYWRQLRSKKLSTTHYEPFFYPLDAIGQWNRIYGKRGLLQWQCVVPDPDVVVRLLETISRSRQGSFLVVLKTFGPLPSPGMLSFPRPGITLALDFPNLGERTFALLDRLDALVAESGGALYPAKDARMSPELFAHSFSRLGEFTPLVDPAFSSSFWRRVRGEARSARAKTA